MRLVAMVQGAPRGDLALSAGGLVVAGLYWVVAAQEPSRTGLLEAVINTGLAVLLVVRRTAVLPAFVATYLLLAAMAILSMASTDVMSASPLLLCAPLSLMAVTDLARSRRWGITALVVAVVGSTVSPVVQGAETKLWVYSAHVLIVVLAYLWAGRARTARAERTREIEGRVALARGEERERISAELHDILGHSLTVIHAQANAALNAYDDTEVAEVLTSIRSVAKASLSDIRSLVALLRGEGVDVPLDLVSDFRRIVEQARAAGLRVDVRLPSDDVLDTWQRSLPPPIRLALVRCVQEGITNALRHGGPGQSAAVGIVQEPTSVNVSVTNTTDRPAGHSPAGGHGLIGLHERVTLLGGRLDAGPTAGGFAVTAHLPVSPSDLTSSR